MKKRKSTKIVRKTPAEIALEIIAAGHFPVPLESASKGTFEEGWTSFRITADQVQERFPAHCNVGILTGVTGLLDVDLDCDEAVALAEDYLPKTGWIWGRKGRPRSHWLYRAYGEVPPTEKMADPKVKGERGMLVEFRTSGHQTLYPGSTHPSGELVTWFERDQAAEVEPPELLRSAKHLAAACLLARNWGVGSRDEVAAALIGVLDRCGWSIPDSEAFLEPVVRFVGDEEAAQRLYKIVRTPRARASGGRIYGFPTLVEKLGKVVVDKLSEWLELDARVEATDQRMPMALRQAFDIVHAPVKASWLLRPYLEEYAIGVLTGDYGTFKSFLALDWACHLATGKRWYNDPRAEK